MHCPCVFKRRVHVAPIIIMTCPFFDRVDDKLIEVDEGWFSTEWISGRRRLVYLKCAFPLTKRVKYQTLTNFFHPGSFRLEEVEYIDLNEKNHHVYFKICTEWEVSKRDGVFMTCLVHVNGGRNTEKKAMDLRQKEYMDKKQFFDEIYFKGKLKYC